MSPASASPPPAPPSAGSVPAPGRPSPPPPPPRCCDTGRPIFQDPVTGQTVCSCQYELLSYQRLASAGVPLSMYSAPYSDAAAAAGMAAYFPALAGDQAPFYTNAVSLLPLYLFTLLYIYMFIRRWICQRMRSIEIEGKT